MDDQVKRNGRGRRKADQGAVSPITQVLQAFLLTAVAGGGGYMYVDYRTSDRYTGTQGAATNGRVDVNEVRIGSLERYAIKNTQTLEKVSETVAESSEELKEQLAGIRLQIAHLPDTLPPEWVRRMLAHQENMLETLDERMSALERQYLRGDN